MKHTKHPAHAVAFAAMAALALLAAPAFAEVTEDTWYLEGGLGYYIGDDIGVAEIESDFLIDFRGGTFLTETWGLEGQIWQVSTDVAGLDIDILGVDVSAVYCFNPSEKHNFFAVGGIGYVDIEDENSFTLHLGAAGRINVTDNFYVRPDARYLYVDDVADESFNNFLITVSAGWVFGK